MKLYARIYQAIKQSERTFKELQYDFNISKTYSFRVAHEMEKDGLVTINREKRPHVVKVREV